MPFKNCRPRQYTSYETIDICQYGVDHQRIHLKKTGQSYNWYETKNKKNCREYSLKVIFASTWHKNEIIFYCSTSDGGRQKTQTISWSLFHHPTVNSTTYIRISINVSSSLLLKCSRQMMENMCVPIDLTFRLCRLLIVDMFDGSQSCINENNELSIDENAYTNVIIVDIT